MKQIPKILHFIWFGNTQPSYVDFSIKSFSQVNPDFRINFIRRNIKELEDIWFNKNIKNIYDSIIYQCIFFILNNQKYIKYIENQKNIYKENIRFIQILSDIVRIEVLNKIGGIYLDCDCFPVKPFDEKLLDLQKFIVVRHYSNSFISTDNYFIGSTKNQKENEIIMPFGKQTNNIAQILQTIKNQSHSILFLKNKLDFFKCNLKIGSYSGKQDFYIDHYSSNSWNMSSGKTIKIPFCKMDFLLKSK